jgi:hypothetical protein
VEEQRHQLLTLTLDVDEWSTSLRGHFTVGMAISGVHWVGLRYDLDNSEKRSRVIAGNFSVITIPTEASQLHLKHRYE